MTGGLRVTAPSPTEIVLTRAFEAPRRLVFDALTQPELLKRWYGAQGWHIVDCKIDLRVGGRWRFVSHGPHGEMVNGGVYREITPSDRLVYTESFEDQWYPGDALVTTVLAEEDGTTTMTVTLLYPSQEVRDVVLRSPMERGTGESYGRLEAVLRELGQSSPVASS